jgi:hypothetical protein
MAEQQQEDKRKKRLLPILLLFAVCLIGVGFAYVAYTENGGNTPAVEYIVLDQSGAGAFSFAPEGTTVYYDTKTYGTGTSTITKHLEYRLADETYEDSPISGAIVVHLGKTFVIDAAKYRGKVLNPTPLATLTCAVTSDFTLTPGWNVYLVITTKNSSDVTQTKIITMKDSETLDNTFTIYPNSSANAYNHVTVDVYYGYEKTNSGDWTSVAPPNYPLSGTEPSSKKLTFAAADDDKWNPIVIDKTEMTLTVGGTDTINIIYPTGVTSATWTPGSTSVATVSATGATCTVTAVAAGDTTVTVTYTHTVGGIEVTSSVECTVHVKAA